MTATRSQTQTSFNKYTDFFDSKVETVKWRITDHPNGGISDHLNGAFLTTP